jgi:exodeoxyribonuclease VII large subunit
MDQFPLFIQATLSVSEITAYLRNLLLDDEVLQDVWVSGEVSNLSRPASGHIYFTVKDASASLRCVMWRNTVLAQRWLPKMGEAIQVHGSIDIYPAGGQYQLYADLIRPVGEGALYQEFLRLKARLEAEGLFDIEKKKPLPPIPRRVGVVTSASGAAIRDILHTLQRRYPLVEVVLAPTLVQGDEAPSGIVAALDALVRLAAPDVILLARGGGSMEDLWAFNDERVARAIAACPVPLVTGIGHETDFTIADFCADLRAPTPTAAAELVTPDKPDLFARIGELSSRLVQASQGMIKSWSYDLVQLQGRLGRLSPLMRVRGDMQRLDELSHRMELSWEHHFILMQSRLRSLSERLVSASPGSILDRGYAIVRKTDGVLVRSVAAVQSGDELDITISDGHIRAKTEQTRKA